MGLGVTISCVALVGLIYFFVSASDISLSPSDVVEFTPEILSNAKKIVNIMEPFLTKLAKCLENCKTADTLLTNDFLRNVLVPVEEIISNNDIKGMATAQFATSVLAICEFVKTNKSALHWTHLDPLLGGKVIRIALELNTAIANG
jgi:hypothetical protein